MSWSIGAIGEPAAAKVALTNQITAAIRGIGNTLESDTSPGALAAGQHEIAALTMVEQVIVSELDFLKTIAGLTVEVQASGGSYKTSSPPIQGSSRLRLLITPIQGSTVSLQPELTPVLIPVAEPVAAADSAPAVDTGSTPTTAGSPPIPAAGSSAATINTVPAAPTPTVPKTVAPAAGTQAGGTSSP